MTQNWNFLSYCHLNNIVHYERKHTKTYPKVRHFNQRVFNLEKKNGNDMGIT